jgi:hypothetical protein
MASEWLTLTSAETGGSVSVNLANACSISPDEFGSVIWFPAGVGHEGKVFVTNPPAEILQMLADVRARQRS